MKRGTKPQTASAKIAKGTFQPCRDAAKVQIEVGDNPPVMPGYLNPEAAEVWSETIARVMAVGIVEADSSLLARYCAMEACCRGTLAKGEPIPATVMTALRQSEELLGIAGPKSRIGRVPDRKEKPAGFSALRAVA